MMGEALDRGSVEKLNIRLMHLEFVDFKIGCICQESQCSVRTLRERLTSFPYAVHLGGTTVHKGLKEYGLQLASVNSSSDSRI